MLGVDEREQEGERERGVGDMQTAASSASHLDFPTVFGLFTSSGVSDRFIPCILAPTR